MSSVAFLIRCAVLYRMLFGTFEGATAVGAEIPCLSARMSQRWTTGLRTTIAVVIETSGVQCAQPEPLAHAVHLLVIGISSFPRGVGCGHRRVPDELGAVLAWYAFSGSISCRPWRRSMGPLSRRHGATNFYVQNGDMLVISPSKAIAESIRTSRWQGRQSGPSKSSQR